jgi:hypothetical protein
MNPCNNANATETRGENKWRDNKPRASSLTSKLKLKLYVYHIDLEVQTLPRPSLFFIHFCRLKLFFLAISRSIYLRRTRRFAGRVVRTLKLLSHPLGSIWKFLPSLARFCLESFMLAQCKWRLSHCFRKGLSIQQEQIY